ncbi:MAG TPA: hypothetical protein VNT32_14885 [Thermoleophilaceae bacterium]|nr:hypothetical protein [Thermoleophilaceae bacterium]
MTTRTRRLTLLTLLIPAAIATAAIGQTSGTRSTQVVAPVADGSSDNVTFSQDNRLVEYVGFDSAATNLVQGDTNGVRDVFVLARNPSEGDLNGTLIRASVASGGGQADGESREPSISGQTGDRARCVTFQSRATNLSSSDRSSDWDVYLYDLRRNATLLVSTSNSDAVHGVVDGECEFVTFESRGRVYVRDLVRRRTARLARGRNPDQQTDGKGVAYERGGQIYYQGFARFRNRGRPKVKRVGREMLVTRNRAGQRGNGRSKNPTMDDRGAYVAFESTATNLCSRNACTGVGSRDRNGRTSDIFRRTIDRRKAPTKDHMQMVSYSQGCSSSNPRSRAVDAQGSGPSNNPAMTGAGENIVFDSEATNLRESSGIQVADANGSIRDVYYWNFPRGRKCGNVSRESRGSQRREDGSGQPLNGANVRPAASNRANYVGWTSQATGDWGEVNGAGIEDIFLRFLGGE